MFVLWALIATAAFCAVDLLYIKTFQLEGYKLKNFWKKIPVHVFSFGKKTPLVFTNRIKRLLFVNFLLNFVLLLIVFGVGLPIWLALVLCLILLLASPVLVMASFVLSLPIENKIKNNFVKKAQKKLDDINCKVVAITGSFGKTSTKNVLYQILKQEFEVTASPKSFNTPMGVCKTILENLKETDDFLILEFGARAKGDIQQLAKMVPVDFGIITPIGNCHLETFGSVQNIEDTKFELCNEVKDAVIFNGASKSTKNLFNRFERKKFLVCEENSFAYAKNICVTPSGSQFVLVLDDVEFECKTKLLGKANIDNIVVASAMAYLLGESAFGIQKGVENLVAVPHRLELIKGQFVDVIDDSYNSNINGFVEALEVLSAFDGKKVVVSPGIVELGASQFEVNRQAAQQVAKKADVFVIMNEINKKALFEGAKQGGMDANKIFFASTREQQKQLLKELLSGGEVVLFENDLPDNIK